MTAPCTHKEAECPAAPLLSVGYGNKRTAEQFIALLRAHAVQILVDVRSKPFSRYRPEFSRESLAAALAACGLHYMFMGDVLGGMPSDPTCYLGEKVDYATVRQRPWFIAGLDRLERGWREGHRIAIMCAEAEPERCHRTKLIGEALAGRNIELHHIDKAGMVISQRQAMERLTGGQGTLFTM